MIHHNGRSIEHYRPKGSYYQSSKKRNIDLVIIGYPIVYKIFFLLVLPVIQIKEVIFLYCSTLHDV